MIPRDAGEQHPARSPKQCRVYFLLHLPSPKVYLPFWRWQNRLNLREFWVLPGLAGMSPAMPAATPSIGEEPVRCWDPEGDSGR